MVCENVKKVMFFSEIDFLHTAHSAVPNLLLFEPNVK